MNVTPIRRLEALEPFAEAWTRLHGQDPHATLFSSWLWLRAWFAERSGEWLVLAVQPDALSPPVAFLSFEVLSRSSGVPGLENRAARDRSWAQRESSHPSAARILLRRACGPSRASLSGRLHL